MDERALIEEVCQVIGEERCRDDCAILPLGETVLVATTDMLHETTDFPEGMTDWQIGWMSAAVTLSDIAAMGASPLAILMAVGLDDPARLCGIIRGAEDCCNASGTHVVGGDIDHHSELTIVSSGIGTVPPGHLVRRSGSKPGDLLGITGTLGRAQAALNGHLQYDRSLKEPVPRSREGEILSAAGATSMMDISDGLSISLYDMLMANPCGYSVYSERIPLLPDIPVEESLELALYGGGDFELLFTVPPAWSPPEDLVYSIIGAVIPDHAVLLDGREMPKKGYEHHWDR